MRRGFAAPDLVISDDAPGLIKAVVELWPDAERQRCTVHKLRNILAKLPGRPELQKRLRKAYRAVLDEAGSPDKVSSPRRRLLEQMFRPLA